MADMIEDADCDGREQGRSQTGGAERPEERPVSASDLPAPEMTKEWKNLPSRPPRVAAPKGFFGAVVRTVRRVPPCVWIINQHTEEITVVVSKYRPNRLLTGGGIDASVGGGGINFSATTFLGPATTKTLAPHVRDREGSIGVFPLWTRSDGFGVVSVFTGPDKKLYIENDRVPAAATAYFINKPNLRIVEFKGGQR
ncbi:hypothetical protein F5Y14DRAFT_257191 [Nemania sp. NC0429]|nr:hypothetical protein F5Y14DRAFT_257191 [Nemania sp. NC0429]